MISLQNRNPIKKDKTISIFSSDDDNGDPLNFLKNSSTKIEENYSDNLK